MKKNLESFNTEEILSIILAVWSAMDLWYNEGFVRQLQYLDYVWNSNLSNFSNPDAYIYWLKYVKFKVHVWLDVSRMLLAQPLKCACVHTRASIYKIYIYITM
jgi:hypothetical protein